MYVYLFIIFSIYFQIETSNVFDAAVVVVVVFIVVFIVVAVVVDCCCCLCLLFQTDMGVYVAVLVQTGSKLSCVEGNMAPKKAMKKKRRSLRVWKSLRQ